ncbi:hypothetical protein Cgig2_017077 [Carnegiea gigantea]|uniref:Aminotransferase-like plant mobile domain-containing protein n=1 Tax=Carnegiea gigantea TaxID=171969 RepID=A0A9Q1JTL3_9CARY|nr:hypothetical protein Cgig2_017077 [Carnegiea gigantea]
MEWTKRVLNHFAEPLNRLAYLISGLPTLGAIYEQFLPLSKALADQNKYLAAIVEQLCIHAELYEFHIVKHIYHNLWLDHFYREYLMYSIIRIKKDSEKEKFTAKKKEPCSHFPSRANGKLECHKGGEHAAFLAFWLSYFVSPYGKEVIRLETFVMAALMAFGLIYHSLGEAVSHPDYHGKANEIFPSYYIIVWLAKLFPCLYHCHPDSDCPGDFPTLIRNAGLLGSKLSLPEARHIFRDRRYLSLKASSYQKDSLVPIQSIPNSLASIFCNLKEDWVLESIIKGVEVIISIISNHGSVRDLLANRAQVSIIACTSLYDDIYKLSTIEIC